MILHPLQNTANGDVQVRPVITQKLGERPEAYAPFGLKGHNGIDFRAKVGTRLFAGIEGIARVGDEGTGGYGKFVEITKPGLKILVAHLSEVLVTNGQKVFIGDLIGKTGNTGNSTAPHLHITTKRTDEHGAVLDYNNGFKGAYDSTEQFITWKGGLIKFDF